MAKPENVKILFLLRHAKARSMAPEITDFDRPLHDDGRRAAELVGEFLNSKDVELDLILSSPALRARETIETVLKTARLDVDVSYDARIYEAGPTQLLEMISQLPEDKEMVMLVGHNPSLEELLQALTGEVRKMSAGAIANIPFTATEWSKVLEEKGKLDWLVGPKELEK
jgi:phosphohistidine phosphatase